MRQTLLLALLAVTAYFYFQNSSSSQSPPTTKVSAEHSDSVAGPAPIIIADTSTLYSRRWKTGANAQTDFEPFVPGEQSTWNRSCGYTITTRDGR
jgi:hypothetical protein